MSTVADLPAGYDLLAQGCSESYDDSGSVATWRYGVPAAIKNPFLQVVAGLPQTFGYGGNTATRIVPLKNPSIYNCYASSIRCEPAPGAVAADDGLGGIIFDYYYVDVTFTTPQFGYDGSEPLVTIERSVSNEMVTRPGTAYVFPSDSTCINHDVGVPVQVVKYSLTFHNLPVLNNALYDSLAGCVSSTAFRGADAGKTLYLGCSSSGVLTMGNSSMWQARHDFEVRSVAWNKVMRPDGNGFEAPVRIGTNNEFLLPTADLNQLYGN